MAIYLSTVGAGTAPVANELRVLAVFKEKVCKAYCVNSTAMPQTTLVYNVGTARLVDTTIFIPITATITVVTPNGCCNANTQVFTETFVVAFQGFSGLPSVGPVVTSLGRDVQPSCVQCGRAQGVTVNDSLLITLTAPTVAPAEG